MTPRGLWRILRLPLVITAVVDVLAGYLMALLPNSFGQFDWRLAGLLAGTSAGLYLFGMVENDLVDLDRDRHTKVPRPLVTGDVGIAGAITLLVLTFLLTAGCASQLRGAVLMLAILTFAMINLYNLAAKSGPAYITMIVMGLCRLLNFGMGVTAFYGFPRGIHDSLALLLPSGPLWAHQAVALFCVTAMVSGYSIAARRGVVMTTRVWQGAFIVTAVAGFGLIAMTTMGPTRDYVQGWITPVARVFAALLLANLWPGGLWSAAGLERKPAEYSRFIERTLYWFIIMDVAFLLDGMLRAMVKP